MKRDKSRNDISMELDGQKDSVSVVKIDAITANPYQPRRTFPEDKIRELAQSIKTYGLLQPIIVRRAGNDYQLVAGERRLLACRSLNWPTITAVVKNIPDSAMAAIALIENLQRENLNFIEEAQGYARLMEEFGFTQEALAQRLGKSQSSIANKVRLLKLSPRVKTELVEGNLTERHARALLKLSTEEEQLKVVEEIVTGGLTVQQAEERIARMAEQGGDSRPKKEGKKAYSKVVIRDLRIFINTLRHALTIIKKSGINPEVTENDGPDYYQFTIRLPKE